MAAKLPCLTYQGTKRTIARPIVDTMHGMFPEKSVFIDLFGGGGAITSAALEYKQDTLFECFKFDKVIYNEINELVYTLYCAYMRGEITKEMVNGYVSRNAFYDVKSNTSAYPALRAAIILYVWSFSNNFDAYFSFNPNKTETQLNDTLKRFEAGKRSLLAKHNIDISKLETSNKDYRNIPIPENALVYCDIPYSNTSDYRRSEDPDAKQVTYFCHNPSTDSQSCVNIHERLDCYIGCREKHTFIGCKCKGRHYDKLLTFDHEKFYEWALSRDFPVFVSEYAMPSDFECVGEWKRKVVVAGRAQQNAPLEKLFYNRGGAHFDFIVTFYKIGFCKVPFTYVLQNRKLVK
jgi:hypothetical protein